MMIQFSEQVLAAMVKDDDDIKGQLDKLIGETVRVVIVPDGMNRNNFGPQIAIAGKLEKLGAERARGKDCYRVLVSDEIFSYFSPEIVVIVNLLTKLPTIALDIKVDVAK